MYALSNNVGVITLSLFLDFKFVYHSDGLRFMR
jgi:hypothetical protein